MRFRSGLGWAMLLIIRGIVLWVWNPLRVRSLVARSFLGREGHAQAAELARSGRAGGSIKIINRSS